MGRAGQSLKYALEHHRISQNRLAVELGLRRSVIYRWVHELSDPTAESVAAIVSALAQLDPTAAETFIDRYLGQLVKGATPQD